MTKKILIICVVLCMISSMSVASQGRSQGAQHREVERELGVLTDPEVDVNLGQTAAQPVAPEKTATEEDKAVEQIRIEEMKKEVKEWDEVLEENKKKKDAEDSEGFIEWRDDSGKIRKQKVE